MNKTILFAIAFSFAAPLAANAAVEVKQNADSVSPTSQTILAGGFFGGLRKDVEGTVNTIKDTEENAEAIDGGVGEIKSMFGGGEDTESDEVVEEVVIEEGTETEVVEEVDESGDSF